MDFNLIQTFLIVAEYQSYSRAAEHLGLTQPAISASMKRLEKETNKSLFVKDGRQIKLTSVAHQLLPKFHQAFAMINDAISDQSTFRLSCNEALIHRITPTNTISICADTDLPSLLNDLRLKQIDLIISPTNIHDPSFMSESIFEEPMVVICRQDHPRIAGKIEQERFYSEKHCRFVGDEDFPVSDTEIHQSGLQERDVEMMTTSLSGMMLYVAKHDCLGVLPLSLAQKWQSALNLQVIQTPMFSEPVSYKLIFHKRDESSTSHQRLRAWARDQFATGLNA
ncbi:LysR family transcriptional regulator [Vibrio parahaemolyticus]|uniref:LysR family transcriptional regulator n=1 Tax=Vibrio parahaemolyticus TaxID=670 RepID=UPI001E3F2756|nr:LysR family transcriptional regulator [Vibrio parahaemolyticus]ELB2134354.1 LysR family transcriptional regulator [Vibrio parahaemolyticus]ELB2137616.1 LysR family transcriptional regulator [Vibrio parahaemolyticus]MCQ9047262.1 LysR family transcriptional regulator [Vibrio parahaemolyticus]MDF4641333.1 LysR family transcriptional regulator [Vibrio parahaemolyticus]